MDKMTKEKYIEEKFNEQKEYYDIPFNKEFDVKALLGLQYDFNAFFESYFGRPQPISRINNYFTETVIKEFYDRYNKNNKNQAEIYCII